MIRSLLESSPGEETWLGACGEPEEADPSHGMGIFTPVPVTRASDIAGRRFWGRKFRHPDRFPRGNVWCFP